MNCMRCFRGRPVARRLALQTGLGAFCLVALGALPWPGLLAADEPGTTGEPRTTTSSKGPVAATVRLEPAEPRLGDDLTLIIEVVAETGVEVLMPAYGEAIERFEVISFLERDTIDDRGNNVHRQQYVLQVSRSGELAIPSLLVEFVDHRPGQKPHPEGEDAYELLTERLEFQVRSMLPADAEAELVPPLGTLPPLPPPAPPRWPYWLGGLGLAVVVLLAAARLLVVWRRRARQRSAYDVARARLEELLAHPRPQDASTIDAFFVELTALVRRYLEDRFRLRAPELTTEEFLALMSESPDLSQEHQRLLRDFLRGADLVKFAHHQPAAGDIEAALRSVADFLEETRDTAPLAERSEAGARPRKEPARV